MGKRNTVIDGKSSIDGKPSIDSKSSPRNSAERIVKSLAERAGAATIPKPVPAKTAVARCVSEKRNLAAPVGAMSQQRSDSGSYSLPQKFVHLVGCHDPKAPPRPTPVKRR
jgi:hypothetical protein